MACIFHPVGPQRQDGHLESSPHQTLKFLWTPVLDSNLQNWETYISVLSKQLDQERLVTAVQTDRRRKGWRKGMVGSRWELQLHQLCLEVQPTGLAGLTLWKAET